MARDDLLRAFEGAPSIDFIELRQSLDGLFDDSFPWLDQESRGDCGGERETRLSD